MKKIYYWCPFIGNIATIKAVINSADSLMKYSNISFEATIIDSCGEWQDYKKYLDLKKIKLKNFSNFFKLDTNISGYLNSRIAYIKIFLSCFASLKNVIKKDKPDFLIAHLITSLPLFLYLIFNFQTKLILRVSGKVKMNFFRKMLWRLNKNNIAYITCPTKETRGDIISLGIINSKKIIYLPDPIIDINKILINKQKKPSFEIIKKNFFVVIGRYTKQKNHLLVIKSFNNLVKKYQNINLLIIGNGELKQKYEREIEKLDLQNKILLVDHQKNIIPFLSRSLGLISSSLWEDPGFVMIEAAASNTFIISSDCSNGPKEFINNKNGILFKNNNSDDLERAVEEYLNMSSESILNKKIGAKKKSIEFTKFRHFKILSNLLIKD